jgi:hypothetical protein
MYYVQLDRSSFRDDFHGDCTKVYVQDSMLVPRARIRVLELLRIVLIASLSECCLESLVRG